MYTKEVKLNHNEVPAKINVETGEIKEVKSRPNNMPENKIPHNPDTFNKVYDTADKFLLKMLTPVEYRVVAILKNSTKMNTNSLEPLSDETSITNLAKVLEIHRNHVNRIISKLRDLGVFATFTVTNQYKQTTTCWILNPYIAFKGRIISKEIIHLFDDTVIAKICS